MVEAMNQSRVNRNDVPSVHQRPSSSVGQPTPADAAR